MLTQTTKSTEQTTENKLKFKELKLWYQDVIPLIFDADKEIQINALSAVEKVLPFFKLSEYQKHENWPAVEHRIKYE